MSDDNTRLRADCARILWGAGYEPEWPPIDGDNVFDDETQRATSAWYAALCLLHLSAEEQSVETAQALYNAKRAESYLTAAKWPLSEAAHMATVGSKYIDSGKKSHDSRKSDPAKIAESQALKAAYEKCVKDYGKKNAIKHLTAMKEGKHPNKVTAKEKDKYRKKIARLK